MDYEGDVAAVPLFPNPTAKRKPKIPFLESVFDHFIANQVVLLFSQEGMAQSPRHLLDHARSAFGKKNVIHLEPLSGEAADYFADLFDQCRLTDTDSNAYAFRKCMEKQADDSHSLLLFITRFEYGNQECGMELANILRSLAGRKPNLNILIMGGPRLADLYFVPGKPLSLLKGSTTTYWEELHTEDTGFFCPDMDLPEETSIILLKISGGHPVLLAECIHHFRKCPEMDESGFAESIKRSDYLWSRFLRLASDEKTKQRLLGILEEEVVSAYMPYIRDDFIRRIFWMNLIKRSLDGRNLVWRSETIRESGKMVCGNF